MAVSTWHIATGSNKQASSPRLFAPSLSIPDKPATNQKSYCMHMNLFIGTCCNFLYFRLLGYCMERGQMARLSGMRG